MKRGKKDVVLLAAWAFGYALLIWVFRIVRRVEVAVEKRKTQITG